MALGIGTFVMNRPALDTIFTRTLGIRYPIIGGPMYPCSNPELVAAVSNAGGIGIVQPVSLTYVYGHDFREGLRYIRSLTDKPIGMNALIEQSSQRYHDKMKQWIEIALEENVRFFITSLGKPDWVVDLVHRSGGKVFHDVTANKWAKKACDTGVDGLIGVNNRAGGHAGHLSIEELYRDIEQFHLPIICAGGIGNSNDVRDALLMGYAGVQIGTRFIATTECAASDAYKQAIVSAKETDIVMSERITGVPVSIIATPYVKRTGTKAGFVAKWLLRGNKTKHWMRMIYSLKSFWQLKRASLDETGKRDYWQAGKSVEHIDSVEPVATVIEKLISF